MTELSDGRFVAVVDRAIRAAGIGLERITTSPRGVPPSERARC